MEGRAGEVQTGAFLVALRTKGETVAELVGLARTMRRLAAEVEAGRDDLVDTAGTGGGPRRSTSRPPPRWSPRAPDARSPSTATAPAPAAAAPPTCWRRSACRSSSGRPRSPRCIDEIGFGFMFAPRHHAAMKHVVPVRKELAVRTIFNFLGPLTNPAGATPAAARGLGSPLPGDDRRGARRPGLRARPGRLRGGRRGRDQHRRGDAGRRGRRTAAPRSGSCDPRISGSSAAEIDRDRRRRARGERGHREGACWTGRTGPARDVVLLNAGGGDPGRRGADDLRGGIERAREAIDSGAARDVLARLVEADRRAGSAA